ncbi:MAG: NAD(P)H-dependent oxidoreductase [Planctomycetota bacterium]
MARILVTYYTRTNKTESMAKEVAEGVKAAGGTAVLKPVGEVAVDELMDYDGIIIGSPTYYGLPASPIKKLLDDSVKHHGKLAGKAGGAFASSGNVAGGNETTIMAILQALLIHGMVIQGTAQGDHYGPVAVHKMDENVTKQCRSLGERVARLAEKLAQ